jgi:Zn-dependent protease
MTQLQLFAVPLIFALSVHEAAHAQAAFWLGDDTAVRAGRASLNPFRHVDLLGSIVLPFLSMLATSGAFALGYAKPVPVAFDRLRQRRRDTILVALAGPTSNIVMAGLWMALACLTGDALQLVHQVARAGVTVNLFVAAFNLIPIPPLDGGRIVRALFFK